MRRAVVVGPVGAGKTTLAKVVSERFGLPLIELDSIRFDGRWRQLPEAEFRTVVSACTNAGQWIVEGNYASVRDVLWTKADTVIWLDYSLFVVLRRLCLRTLRRLVSREDLGSGRRENVSRLLGSRSILLWAIRSHGSLRAEYERASAIYGSQTDVVRLHSPTDAERWLHELQL